jgi:hypothetical protein
MVTGMHRAPFRITVPRGAGSYRFVMYGHGTGGNVRDGAFDQEIASNGAAKVGLQFSGWTDEDVIHTFENFANSSRRCWIPRGRSCHRPLSLT